MLLSADAQLDRTARGVAGVDLIASLLREQQTLNTAVDRFSQLHDAAAVPEQARYYRNLIPLSKPQPGEQYAFEVDLDTCSGCKACVTACHNLNGLEDQELWRSVGLLHGGSSQLPVLQHVTTACHHCVEPACLEGCPVKAYDKDPITGIVRHLDDQCIGCQYCILKCPYDVPKYSKSKGIVRKCDMCSNRLAVGEAPACVQACPNQAIRIAIVSKQAIIEESEGGVFLPGAPEPRYTLPTTVYKTARTLPRNLLPADYYSVQSSHSHLPLVVMLVMSQMSVGAFVIERFLTTWSTWFSDPQLGNFRLAHLVGAIGLGVLGSVAAVGHLGRPLYAFRAIIGLATSWLSREIVAFGAFTGLASAYAGSAWLQQRGLAISPALLNMLGASAALAGLFGVVCSIMIYVDTQRPFWDGTSTTLKFMLTGVVLGLPTALLISLFAALASQSLTLTQVMNEYGTLLCRATLVAVGVKLLYECLIFTHLRNKHQTPLKRTARLMTGELRQAVVWRFALGISGGLLLPAILLAQPWSGAGQVTQSVLLLITATALFGLSLAGELLERYLFFTAVVAPKMPGSLPS